MRPDVHRVAFARRALGVSTDVPVHADGDAIPFDSGHAYPGVLPDLVEPARRALTQYRPEVLQYAPRFGLPDLREWIAEHMRADGVDISSEEVLVVNGAKHGLDLLCRLLLDEGDSIVVTAPTYFTAIPIFKSFGARLIEVDQDEQGLSVDALEQRLAHLAREGGRPPKFIYDIPDFHNPAGVTMTRQRREALLDVAARYGMFVIEDSPYRKIRFEGDSEPLLKSIDDSNTVIGLGTFAKLIAPGLRIGWITATPEVLARVAQLKSDGGSCPLTQRVIVEFCADGGIEGHTNRVRETYRIHRDTAVTTVRRELPEAHFTVPEGGYYLWLTLPAHVDGDAVAAQARKEGVIVIPGSKFFAGAGRNHPSNEGVPRNHIRIAYSHASPEEIEEGMKRLARAYQTMTS